MNAFAHQIGERIRLARDEKEITQEAFAKALGWNSHQTVSAVETGLRQLQPEELTRISEVLDQPLAFFIDPYVVTEKRAFSYRAKANTADLAAFEKKAHKLISAGRRFRELLGEPALTFGNRLRNVGPQSTLDAARRCGEETAKALELGDAPALKLREAIEGRLNVMVLFVDAPGSISGAACHLSDGDFIMINRREVSFRRNYDLGHELFHILTWDTMPPEKNDTILAEAEKPKPEKLADAFTAGLLMPIGSIRARWQRRAPTTPLRPWMIQNARELHVSGQALYWRLVNAGLLGRAEAEAIEPDSLSRSDGPEPGGKPNLYSADFVRRLHSVLELGRVTARKAAELLDCELDDLAALFAAYGHSTPFTL